MNMCGNRFSTVHVFIAQHVAERRKIHGNLVQVKKVCDKSQTHTDLHSAIIMKLVKSTIKYQIIV